MLNSGFSFSCAYYCQPLISCGLSQPLSAQIIFLFAIGKVHFKLLSENGCQQAGARYALVNNRRLHSLAPNDLLVKCFPAFYETYL